MGRKLKFFLIGFVIGLLVAMIPPMLDVFFLSPLGSFLGLFTLSVFVLLPVINLFAHGILTLVVIVVVNGLIYGLLGLLIEKISRK